MKYAVMVNHQNSQPKLVNGFIIAGVQLVDCSISALMAAEAAVGYSSNLAM